MTYQLSYIPKLRLYNCFCKWFSEVKTVELINYNYSSHFNFSGAQFNRAVSRSQELLSVINKERIFYYAREDKCLKLFFKVENYYKIYSKMQSSWGR